MSSPTIYNQENPNNPKTIFEFFKQTSNNYFIFDEKSPLDDLPFLDSKYQIFFCIAIPIDSEKESDNLKQTIDSILVDIVEIIKLSTITASQIFIYFFLQKLTVETNLYSLFLNEEESSLENKMILKTKYNNLKPTDFLGKTIQLNYNEIPEIRINGVLIVQNKLLTHVEINKILFKLFDTYVKDQNISNKLFTYFLTSGIQPTKYSIYKLLLTTYEEKSNMNICNVPAVQTTPSNFFSKIRQYEYVHYNIYDLSFYNMSYAVPVNMNFCLFKLTPKEIRNLNQFYEDKINIDASLQYHSNLLALYLTELGYSITYVPFIEAVKVKETISFAELMYDYSQKLQAHLAVNYNLLKTHLTFCGCNILKKILLIMHLIGTFFEFAFPCFCTMVIYVIYKEGLSVFYSDNSTIIVLTSLYAFLTIIYGFVSLLFPNPNDNSILFFVLYIINELYLIITLIFGLPAIHHVNKFNVSKGYKINIPAITLLIVLNFIIGIIPLFVNCRHFKKNFGYMFLYLLFGTANYTSLFLVHGICNMTNAYGKTTVSASENYLQKESQSNAAPKYTSKQGIILICYILGNTLLSLLIILLTTMEKRMTFLIAISSIFTVYNACKLLAILFTKFHEVNPKEKEIEKKDILEKIYHLINETITDVERTNNQYIAKGNSLSDSKINEYLNLHNNVNNQNARGESI